VSELETYGRAVVRGWWIVALAVAAALLTAFLLTSRQEPTYQARTTVVVAPSTRVDQPGDVLRSLETLDRRTVVATFARIPATTALREAVADELALAPRELRGYRIRGTVLPYTNLIRIEVEGPDPVRAAQVANTASSVTAREARELYSIYSLRPFEVAAPPGRPISPDHRRALAVGGVFGLLFGLGGAVGFELLGGRALLGARRVVSAADTP
jgi:capsular polysaccharide biosynthesis protein